MAHKNKYSSILLREDLHYALTTYSTKQSKGRKGLVSKTKILEQIVKDFFQIKDDKK